MDTQSLISFLQRFPDELAGALAGVADSLVCWKPAPGQWSILEIVCHLADEEAEDFGVRMKLTVEGRGELWPAIDTVGWPLQRNYQSRSIDGELARFRRQRADWLVWLSALKSEALQAVYTHPKMGSIRAGDLLLAWATHDQLHMKQIVKRKYQWLCEQGKPFQADYAGPWVL